MFRTFRTIFISVECTSPNTYHPLLRGNLYTIIADIIQYLLIMKDYFYVHAACLTKNESTILLPAFPGVGKTISTFKLIQEGWKCIGDDLIPIQNDYPLPNYGDSTISSSDFISLVTPDEIGQTKYRSLQLQSLVEKFPYLMKFIPLPKYKITNEVSKNPPKINKVIIIEPGKSNITKLSTDSAYQKILAINNYSLQHPIKNRMLWMYSNFNEKFSLTDMQEKENANLLKFIENKDVYLISCNDKQWIELINEMLLKEA